MVASESGEDARRPIARSLDAVIVGAGFAGLYMLHRMRGLGLSALLVEAGSGVGGTWFWNRYPGARCDVDSLEYSFSFSEELQQQWTWSERFATQPEILQYLNHVAEAPVATMAHRLKVPEGRTLHALRKQTPEPVFGIIKTVPGLRQFSMRGLNKARGERSRVTSA